MTDLRHGETPPAEAPANGAHGGTGSRAPFFIIGSGRSGSTLLRLILTRHSRLCVPPETWFLLDLVARFPLNRTLSDADRDAAVGLMTANYRWPDFGIDAEGFARRARTLDAPSVKSLADLVYDDLRRREGKPRWGDKTPTYVRIVPRIAELYPDAKFIHLVRDGRDVAKSFQDRGWYGRWIHQGAKEWIEAVDAMAEHERRIAPERLYTLRYEDLVLDTEKTVRAVCAFLGEPFEPSMLDWEDSVREKVPERELHIHQKLFRKPRASDIDRWKRELNPLRVYFLESHIAGRLRAQGYQPRFDGPLARAAAPAMRLAGALVLPPFGFALRAVRAAGRRLGLATPSSAAARSDRD